MLDVDSEHLAIHCNFREENPENCLKTTDGENMAKKIGAIAYIATSSVTKEAVAFVRWNFLW